VYAVFNDKLRVIVVKIYKLGGNNCIDEPVKRCGVVVN